MVEAAAQDGATRESGADTDDEYLCVAVGAGGFPAEAGGRCEEFGGGVLGEGWRGRDGGV